jgi:signal transduction histidine kinase
VENAIKYSKDEKFVAIRLYSEDKNVILEVEDNGVGMTKKVTSQIFDKFYRAEDTLTAQTKGHGLGLSIVKNMVELNGGSIHVTSEPGEGSIFTVTFPIHDEYSAESSQAQPTSSPEIRSESINKEPASYVS